MARVYCIETDGLIWYVGSTAQSLNKREIQHRSRRRNGLTNVSEFAKLPNEYEYKFRLLEECPVENKIERECHYYDTLKPFFGRRAVCDRTKFLRTDKERYKQYYQEKKEEIKNRVKQYANENKEKVSERAKEYYQNHKEEIIERVREYEKQKKLLSQKHSDSLK